MSPGTSDIPYLSRSLLFPVQADYVAEIEMVQLTSPRSNATGNTAGHINIHRLVTGLLIAKVKHAPLDRQAQYKWPAQQPLFAACGNCPGFGWTSSTCMLHITDLTPRVHLKLEDILKLSRFTTMSYFDT